MGTTIIGSLFVLVFIALPIGWIVLSIVASNIATKKGRSGGGVLLASLVFSPVIGLLIALLMSTDQSQINAVALMSGVLKRCPKCAESVQAAAQVCRFCGNTVFPEMSDAEYQRVYGPAALKRRHEALRTAGGAQ